MRKDDAARAGILLDVRPSIKLSPVRTAARPIMHDKKTRTIFRAGRQNQSYLEMIEPYT